MVSVTRRERGRERRWYCDEDVSFKFFHAAARGRRSGLRGRREDRRERRRENGWGTLQTVVVDLGKTGDPTPVSLLGPNPSRPAMSRPKETQRVRLS